MTSYIDIHAHLDFPQILPNIDNIIKNAEKNNLSIILTNGVDPETNRTSLKLASKHKIVKAALGFYPPDAWHTELEEGNNHKNKFQFDWEVFEEELKFIKKNKDKIIAIGEIGMDYQNCLDKDLQIKVFRAMLNLAKELGKPVIIHSRKAESDVIDILEQEGMKKVILHCFCGKKILIKKAKELGYYFSIPTNVVRAQNIQNIVEMIPLSRLFAETDSPFLSPFKEKQNEPSYIIESYKKIAEIKGLTLEEAANNIFMNYQKLF